MINRQVLYEYKQKLEENIEAEMSKPVNQVTLQNLHMMLEINRYINIIKKKD